MSLFRFTVRPYAVRCEDVVSRVGGGVQEKVFGRCTFLVFDRMSRRPGSTLTDCQSVRRGLKVQHAEEPARPSLDAPQCSVYL